MPGLQNTDPDYCILKLHIRNWFFVPLLNYRLPAQKVDFYTTSIGNFRQAGLSWYSDCQVQHVQLISLNIFCQ